MQKCSLLLMVCLLVACLSCTGPLCGKTDSEAEEYSVYSALISSEYVYEFTQSLVIIDETLPVELLSDFNGMFESPISQEMVADFKTKIESPYPLSNLFSLPVEYTLVDLQEVLEEDFLENNPNVYAVIGLSRVGFNPEVDQALVYLAYYCSPVCAEDGFFLLEKENGAWKVQEKHIMGRA